MSRIDCEEFLREIELYLDRELPEGQCLQIEAHLSYCTPCLHHYEFRRRLQVIVARKCRSESVPESLLRRVKRLVEQDPEG